MEQADPDYVLQQELEALAGNAATPNEAEGDDVGKTTAPEPMSTTITRWQTLFDLSASAAIERIHTHRNNLTRPRISSSHWEMIQREQEARGYDREAYEYSLELQKRRAALPDTLPAAEGSGVTYLVELSGPLDTADKVRRAAGMAEGPVTVSGRSVEEMREVELCCVDEGAKVALLKWAADEGAGFEPTILVDPRSLR